MKRHWRIIVLVLLVVALACLFLQIAGRREPVYQGKSLSAWLDDMGYRSDGIPLEDELRNKAAADAIHQIGTNGLPHLLKLVRSKDGPAKAKFTDWVNKQTVIRIQLRTASQRSHQGFLGIRALGNDAKPLMAEFKRMLDASDQEEAQMGALCLSAIGTEASPSLLQVMTNRHSKVRLIAVHSFREFGTNSTSAIPALIQALNDPDSDVREDVAWTLGQLKQSPASVVPALISALQDTNNGSRLEAAAALKEFGEHAKPAVPALERALHDQHAWVRNAAVESLMVVAPELSDQVVASLVKDLSDPDEFNRQEAAELLGKLGDKSKAAVPALLNLLVDETNSIPYTPYAAAEALRLIGKDGLNQGLIMLTNNLRHPNPVARRNTADTLRHLETGALPATTALVGALADEDGSVRNAAAEALTVIAPDEATNALPALIENIQNRDARVRMDAARILWEMGPRARPAAPTLISALEDRDPSVRYSVASALRQIVPEMAAEVVSILIRQLSQSDTEMRVSSARALEEFGVLATAAVPELMKSVRDKDSSVRQAVGSALKKIDPASASRAGIE